MTKLEKKRAAEMKAGAKRAPLVDAEMKAWKEKSVKEQAETPHRLADRVKPEEIYLNLPPVDPDVYFPPAVLSKSKRADELHKKTYHVSWWRKLWRRALILCWR